MEALYMNDSYLKEFESVVNSVNQGKFVVLDKTAFYPNSGGQPYDTGTLTRQSDGKVFKVVFVGKFSGDISHEVENPDSDKLKTGDKVKGTVDWDRRYKLMRYHTAAHIISGYIHDKTGAMITGNQLGTDKSRIDYSLDDYDPEKIKSYISEVNKLAKKGSDVKVSFITREEAEKTEGISKLAAGLPPGIKEIRIVDIVGIDKQADGGTHVNNTKEIGEIEVLKCDNKGKNNRRVYFIIKD